MNVVARQSRQVARPLKVLVPLIQEELVAGNEAGLEHYRRAGVMLVEAKDQVSHGGWGPWLNKNFELSRWTAQRYMRLARLPDDSDDQKEHDAPIRTLAGSLGMRPARAAWTSVHQAADKLNVKRFAEEREARENEIQLHRELALKLIDLGYRAMATRLHPDRGGSRDAMARLNVVRDELKSIAENRRFV
jgi:hypothetical protein